MNEQDYKCVDNSRAGRLFISLKSDCAFCHSTSGTVPYMISHFFWISSPNFFNSSTDPCLAPCTSISGGTLLNSYKNPVERARSTTPLPNGRRTVSYIRKTSGIFPCDTDLSENSRPRMNVSFLDRSGQSSDDG